jgi:DNA-binding FadR family transcriptional regulator
MHEQIYRAILNRQGRAASLAVEKLVEETLKRYTKAR